MKDTMHNPGATLRQSLEHQWQRLPSIPVDDERVRKLIDRLEVEISALQAAGHTWVTERINRFGDKINWSGYCMEVHFAAGLLSNEVNPRPAVKLLDGDDSDVDFVVRADPGIQVNFELVCIGEYLKARKLITDGAYAKLHQVYYRRHGEKNRPHGDKGTRDRNPAEHPISETTGELYELKRVQRVLREKTLNRNNNSPHKFPAPRSGEYNVLVIDVSGVLVGMLDDADFCLMAYGRRAVPEALAGCVLGFFAQRNDLGCPFDREFAQNRYLRERVHAVIFLQDSSRWVSPLDPPYEGMLVPNPALLSTEAVQPFLTLLRKAFKGWVPTWKRESDWRNAR